MQVVAEAATGAVQRWIQLNDETTARIMKSEERGTHRVAEEALHWVERGSAGLEGVAEEEG